MMRHIENSVNKFLKFLLIIYTRTLYILRHFYLSNGIQAASALAFESLLSLVPLLTVMFGLFGHISVLQDFWDDKDLQLCVPFYDSFLFKNSLTFAVCFPKFDFTKPIFFTEDNDMPFDYIIKKKVETYCHENKFQSLPVKSVYYELRDDFKAYLTFRCINNRTTLDNPRFDHLCSSEFSFQSWKEAQA